MSHVSKVNVEIKDLAALKAACRELGLTWMEGKETYEWYGRSVGDFPLPEGFTADDLGKCHHAIKVNDEKYEIGVVKRGQGYRLLFDSWDAVRATHMNGLCRTLGTNLEKLVQMYSVHKVELEARRKGMICSRFALPNGSIKLKIGVRG